MRGSSGGSGWRLGVSLSGGRGGFGSGSRLVELGLRGSEVDVDRLFEQAALLGREVLGLGGELQSLEHRHLVRDLVDHLLLEGELGRAATVTIASSSGLSMEASSLSLITG